LDELGMTKSILALADKLSDSSRIEFKTELAGLDDALPRAFEIHFYRVVQESLSNVIKHSRATAATIRAQARKDIIRLEIWDNGCGCDTSSFESGCGLASISERVRTMGGTVSFVSQPEKGMRIEIVLPTIRDCPPEDSPRAKSFS